MADNKSGSELLAEIYRNTHYALQSISDIMPETEDAELIEQLKQMHKPDWLRGPMGLDVFPSRLELYGVPFILVLLVKLQETLEHCLKRTTVPVVFLVFLFFIFLK